ncbi:MAG: hypothetical protein DWH94_06905 [Planctomycetota bacterium]|nr:MAG: hypothetical protein DWH94_06905 [Planctomycetota bacterium]
MSVQKYPRGGQSEKTHDATITPCKKRSILRKHSIKASRTRGNWATGDAEMAASHRSICYNSAFNQTSIQHVWRNACE